MRGFQIVSLDDIEFAEGHQQRCLLDNTMGIQYDTSNETVVPKESPSNILNTSFNLDDIASIMFTSGTALKKRCHKRFVIIMPVQSDVKRAWDSDCDTNWLFVLPIYHISVNSSVLLRVIEGFTVPIVDNSMPNKF